MCTTNQIMIKSIYTLLFIANAIQFLEATEGRSGMVSKERHEEYAKEVWSVCDANEEIFRTGGCFERDIGESQSCGQYRLEETQTQMRSKVQASSKEVESWQGWYMLMIAPPRNSI